MFQMKKATTLQAQVDVLEAMAFTDKVHIKDAFKKDIICKDEQNCQRLVSEPELESLLVQGWHVVMCLPSGKIVVSNER